MRIVGEFVSGNFLVVLSADELETFRSNVNLGRESAHDLVSRIYSTVKGNRKVKRTCGALMRRNTYLKTITVDEFLSLVASNNLTNLICRQAPGESIRELFDYIKAKSP